MLRIRAGSSLFGAVLGTSLLLAPLPAQTALPAWSPARNLAGGRNPAMAYDVARERVVRFDAQGIWEWDGARWSSRNDAVGPSPRTFSAAAYDLARCSMVMSAARPLVDGRGHVGMGWRELGLAQRLPTATCTLGPCDAYDTARRRTVVFGGCTATAGLLADTWEWDGTTWRSLIAAGPIARHAHALAYDLARQRTVLFAVKTAAACCSRHLGVGWRQLDAAPHRDQSIGAPWIGNGL